MPKEIIVASQKYFNQPKNGIAFDQNTSDFSTNLVGVVDETILADIEILIGCHFSASVTNPVTVKKLGDNYLITRTSGSWIKDGFSVTDIVFADNNDGGSTLTVVDVTDLQMLVYYDGVYFEGTSTIMTFAVKTPLTYIEHRFGLIENSEAFNIKSKVSNNDQIYYAVGVGEVVEGIRSTEYVDFIRMGNFIDWETESYVSRCKFLSMESDFPYYQKYKIQHYFKITPSILEEYQENINSGLIPTIFNGQKSLKYAFETEFRNVKSLPLSAKSVRYEKNKGSVGYYNQNYNGFKNIYSIESIEYKDVDTDTEADGLIVSKKTRVTIVVDKSIGNFNDNEVFGLSVNYAARQEEYTNTLTTYEQNFLFDIAYNEEGEPATIGRNSIIKSLSGSKSTNQLTIVAEIEYTPTQQLRLVNSAQYVIGVIVADGTLSTANSDKMNLNTPLTDYVYSSDIEGLIFIDSFDITQHNSGLENIGNTSLTCWVEDGLIFRYKFGIDLNKKAFVNELVFKIVAYKDEDNKFELDSIQIPITSTDVVAGIQQLFYSETRGYNLAPNDEFNLLQITPSTYDDEQNIQYYELIVGQKISWQTWILNSNVDNIFLDNTKENQNKNFNTSNYSGLNSYNIRAVLAANVYGENALGQSGNTNYELVSPVITVNDYDKPTTWTGYITTSSIDETIDYGGALSTDKDTLITATYTREGAFREGADFWAINRIEPSKNVSSNIFECSSLKSRPSNDLLKPISGENFAEITVIEAENKVIVKCLADKTKINKNVNYKLSSRLDDGLGSLLGNYMQYEDGTFMKTEDGQYMKYED